MTENTSSVLVEVSSSDSIDVCYEIMDIFIKETRLISPSIEMDQVNINLNLILHTIFVVDESI